MRIHGSYPRFDVDASTKVRFAKTLKAFSGEAGAVISIDSIDVKALAHQWAFASEDEFDRVNKLPEKIEEMTILFSDKKGDLKGLVCFGPNIAYGSWEGPARLAPALQVAMGEFVREEYRLFIARSKKAPAVARESFRVKHCELDADALRALALSILASEENLDVGIEGLQFSASGESLTLYEDNLDRILDNPSLPPVCYEFTITSRARSPRVNVTIRRFRHSNVQIEGPHPWVRAKRMRLRNFFNSHPNSDILGRSQLVLAILIALVGSGSALLIALTLNRIFWSRDLLDVVVGGLFVGLLLGFFAYSTVEEKVTRSWVSASARQKTIFRSITGAFLVLLVSEVAALALGLALGWLAATP